MTDYRKLHDAQSIAWEWGQGVTDAETAIRKLHKLFPIDAALAEKVEPVALHFLDRDNDGHWYVVQESKRQEWEKWLQIPSDDQASWDAPDFAKPVGGAPNTVSFYTAAPASQWRRVEDEKQPLDTPSMYELMDYPAPVDDSAHVEKGWLIEIGYSQHNDLRYQTMVNGVRMWTESSEDALRFCRKQDAERFAAASGLKCRIAEHVFHGKPLPALPEDK